MHQCIHLHTYPPNYLPTYLPVCLSIHLSIYLSIDQLINQSIFASFPIVAIENNINFSSLCGEGTQEEPFIFIDRNAINQTPAVLVDKCAVELPSSPTDQICMPTPMFH